MKTFGEIIYHYRIISKKTLRQFANDIGKSPAFVSMLENNKNLGSASEETIGIMAEKLGIDKENLIRMARKVPEKELDIQQKKARAFFRKDFKRRRDEGK